MNQKAFYHFLINFKFICDQAIEQLKEAEEIKQADKNIDTKQFMNKTMKKLFTSVSVANFPANNFPSNNAPADDVPVAKAQANRRRVAKRRVVEAPVENVANVSVVADTPVAIIAVDPVPVDIALATNALSEEIKQGKAKKTKKSRCKPKDPLAPKMPKPAFAYFFKEQSDKFKESDQIHPGVSQMSKMVGERWKKLPSELKQQYLDLAKKDRSRYQQELELYKKSQQRVSGTKVEANEEKRETKIKKIIMAPEKKQNKR